MSPLQAVQAVLRRVGIYNRLRGSAIYDWYWMIVDRRLIDERNAQLRFYRALLEGMRPGDLVFDIGANQGVKTDIFIRMGARVVAVDPDAANEAVLKAKFLTLRFRPKPVIVVPQAVSDKEAVETLWIDTPGSTMNTLSAKWVQTLRSDDRRFGATLDFSQTRQISTITLDRLMDQYGRPYFVKIDVEGFEPAVLRGMHQPVAFLSFEVNLPEFRPEGLECVCLLAGIAGSGVFNYTVDNAAGLALREWLPPHAFAEVLENCSAPSIEVFWKNPRP